MKASFKVMFNYFKNTHTSTIDKLLLNNKLSITARF